MNPSVPMLLGWSSGITPLPWKVLATPNPEFVGEPHQCRGGVPARGAVPGQHDRPLRVAQDIHRPRYLTGRRRLRMNHVARQGCQVIVGFVEIQVFGHRQIDRCRAFGLGELERFAEHLRYRVRGGDTGGPAGDRGEHRDQVDVLVRLFVLAVLADLRGDRDHGSAVGGGVGDAQLHVDRARTQGGRYHRRAAGNPAVHLGHERRRLLVPGQDVADVRGGQRLHEADVLFAGYPEDDGNALVFQALDHQLSGFTHPAPPLWER